MFIGFMMHNAWEFYEQHHATMNTASVGGFFTYVAALLGAFVKSVNNIQVGHSDDSV